MLNPSSKNCGLSTQTVTSDAAWPGGTGVSIKFSFRGRSMACTERNEMHGNVRPYFSPPKTLHFPLDIYCMVSCTKLPQFAFASIVSSNIRTVYPIF